MMQDELENILHILTLAGLPVLDGFGGVSVVALAAVVAVPARRIVPAP